MLYLLWLLASGAVRTIAAPDGMCTFTVKFNQLGSESSLSPAIFFAPSGSTASFGTCMNLAAAQSNSAPYSVQEKAISCDNLYGLKTQVMMLDSDTPVAPGDCCYGTNVITSTVEDCSPTPPTTNGDPITMFHGQQMRYWLSAEHFTPVFEQGPLILSQLAGPSNPPPGLEEQKGAWVVATELNLAGQDKIRIEVVDPTTLLAPPNATAATTAAADALTTMRLSFGGKQLAAGEHTLSVLGMPASVTAARVDQKHKIGSGFVDEIHIKAQGLHLRISSSVANKFADEKLQVLGLHLDLEFLTFDQAKVRGALPEMWGLQPMSEGTKLLLDKKNVDN